MTHFNIYGKYEPTLNIILDNIISQIKTYNDMEVQKSGEKAYEHLIYRVKDKDSMLENALAKIYRRQLILLYMIFKMPSVFVSSVALLMISTKTLII